MMETKKRTKCLVRITEYDNLVRCREAYIDLVNALFDTAYIGLNGRLQLNGSFAAEVLRRMLPEDYDAKINELKQRKENQNE